MSNRDTLTVSVLQYRSRIYEKYASCFKSAGTTFDAAAARKWGKAYDRYLRGWLPRDRSARITDVACGAGGLLYFLKDRGYTQPSGADVSAEQVALARHVVTAVAQQDVVAFLRAQPAAFDLVTALDL